MQQVLDYQDMIKERLARDLHWLANHIQEKPEIPLAEYLSNVQLLHDKYLKMEAVLSANLVVSMKPQHKTG